MSNIKPGDYVWFQSIQGKKVWYGQVEGFCFKGHVAICTDGTGLSSRPVESGRLHFDPYGASRCRLAALLASE